MSHRPPRLEFPLPMAEPAVGIPLVNPSFGVLLWGDRASVRLTLSLPPGERQPSCPESEPLPLGRIDLELPSEWSLEACTVTLETGEAEVELQSRGKAAMLRATVLLGLPVLCIRVTGVDGTQVQVVPRPPDSPEVLERMRDVGAGRSQTFDLTDFAGWVREDDGCVLCVGWLPAVAPGGLVLYITAAFALTISEARKTVLSVLDSARSQGYTPATLRSFGARRRWWSGLPASLQHPVLQPLLYAQVGSDALAESEAALEVSQVEGSVWRITADRQLILVGEAGGSAQGCIPLAVLSPTWLQGTAISGHRRELPRGLPRGYTPPR